MDSYKKRVCRQISFILGFEISLAMAVIFRTPVLNDPDIYLPWWYISSGIIFLLVVTISGIFSIGTKKKEKIATFVLLTAFLFIPLLAMLPINNVLKIITNVCSLTLFILAAIIDSDFFNYNKTDNYLLGTSFLIPIWFLLAYSIIGGFIVGGQGLLVVVLLFIPLFIGLTVLLCFLVSKTFLRYRQKCSNVN